MAIFLVGVIPFCFTWSSVLLLELWRGPSSLESVLLAFRFDLYVDAGCRSPLLLDRPLLIGLLLRLSLFLLIGDFDLRCHLLDVEGGDLSGSCGGDLSLSLLLDFSTLRL